MGTPTSIFTEDLDAVLDATRADWEALRGKRIAVTGGTGFVGRWMLESFLHANERLTLNAACTVLTRRPDAFRASAPHVALHPAIDIVEGDVRTADFPDEQWYGVIHAAADPQSRFTSGEDIGDVIVNGTRRMIGNAFMRHAEKFLFISSGAVYGTLHGAPADEYETSPDQSELLTSYARSKRAAERVCLDAHAAFAPVIARLFAFVGPLLPLDEQFAVGNFIGDGLAGRTVNVRGDGSAVRSYLYAADMAAWLWMAFFRGSPHGIYNIGSAEAHTITDIAERTASLFEPRPRVVTGAGASGAGTYYVPSVARITSELGARETTDITTALEKTIAWHRLQPQESTVAS